MTISDRPVEQIQDLFYVNGINASTGAYIEPPIAAGEVAKIAIETASEVSAALQDEIESRVGHTAESMATVFDVDVDDLAQTGWGVVFARDADPALRQALQPLLDRRRQQAGEHYREYVGDDGFLPQDTWESFRQRHGVGSGLANPEEMPYYMLIVGDPATIPYSFQYGLDLERAAGRIHFDTLESYTLYAESVVQAEEAKVRLPRRATFFATHNPDDKATGLSYRELTLPMSETLARELAVLPAEQQWTIDMVHPEQATKAALLRQLGGSDTPALLFTATHGAGFDQTDRRQVLHQGALVTQDWPGPVLWQQPLSALEHYVAADDVRDSASLWGLIAFFFACFGAGSPALNDFYHRREHDHREQLVVSENPFLARLPQRLLGHPDGGALAVLGHVDRAWDSSFQFPGMGGRDIGAIQRLLKALMVGYPIGYALEELNSKYAQHASELTINLFPILHQGLEMTPDVAHQIARLWTANQDARNYIIVGDPAVRLPLAATEAEPVRPAIDVVRPVTGTPGSSGTPKATGTGSGQTGSPTGSGVDDTHSFTPLPPLSDDLRAAYPELTQAWVDHIAQGYRNNDRVFQEILDAFLRSHRYTLAMHWIVFIVGIGLFLLASVVALVQQAPLAGALFGGLSVMSFLLYFVSRPAQAIEENLMYVTWLGMIYNSYWTHLAWAFDHGTAQGELDRATEAAIEQLEKLIDKHAAAVKARPSITQTLWNRAERQDE